MSWITSGKLDAVLDIKFPHHPDEKVDIKAILEEIGRNVSVITHQGTHPDDIASQAADAAAAAEASSPRDVLPGQQRLARPPLRAPHAPTIAATDGTEEKRQVTVDIDLRFRDLKAAVPMFTSDLSVRNNALIRPIVAFIK
jgi:distribution and morphology protein 31